MLTPYLRACHTLAIAKSQVGNHARPQARPHLMLSLI